MIGITVTFMFHRFLALWQGLGICPAFHFLSISHPLDEKFFLIIEIRSGLPAWIG